MKRIKLFLLPLLLSFSCAHESATPEVIRTVRLQSEEYFDSTNSGSSGDFVRLYKKIYHYSQNKLVRIDAYDFNPYTHAYDSSYTDEMYDYTSEGRLSQRVQFIGTTGLRWIKAYEYLNATSTKVTRYESNNSNTKNLQDWWVIERTPSLLIVKYYQGNNELYAQVTYEINSKGNVMSVTGYPSKIYYEYDNSPNPYKFLELGGEYGFDSEKYLSENNVVTVTNDSNKKSNQIIEYNADGYPITIITSTSKRILTYQ